MASARKKRLALAMTGIMVLAACTDGQGIGLFDRPSNGAGLSDANSLASGDAALIEQDVEAPEVFQQTDAGLWDGRPSLGGVWIAHPNVDEPERVIIRNEDNGKFIIGALFRRERENPGPRFQVSSDAATELGMLAGAPATLSVVALRREAVPVVREDVATLENPVIADIETAQIGTPETIEATPVDPVAAIAASAIEAATASNPPASLPAPANAAEAAIAATPGAAVPVPVPAPVQTAPSPALERPFVQIGIFSIETNADDTSKLLRSSGVIPTTKVSTSNGKTYWRVVVGPINNTADRAAVISKVKGLGFTDAYAVTN